MEANVIKVGNSKGIILPAKFLKLMEIEEKVTIDIVDNKMVLSKPQTEPREGWEARMAEEITRHGQPELLMPEFFNDDNLDDWTW